MASFLLWQTILWNSCCHGFLTETDYTLEQVLSGLPHYDSLYPGIGIVKASLLFQTGLWNRCCHGFSTVTDCTLGQVLSWFLHWDRLYPVTGVFISLLKQTLPYKSWFPVLLHWDRLYSITGALASLFCQTVSWNTCCHDFSIVTDYTLDLGIKRNFSLLKWHFSQIFLQQLEK